MASPLGHLKLSEQTKERIEVFRDNFGPPTFDLACHAAFPLTLTTDLVYCLRENFVSKAPWYGAADVLLSGFCPSVGHDLYEMTGETRQGLLRELVHRHGEKYLDKLEDFMRDYLAFRLQEETSPRARQLAGEYSWTALACLRPDEFREKILHRLQQVHESNDRREQLRLASILYSYDDLLSNAGFAPLQLKSWANNLAAGQKIEADSFSKLVEKLKTAGFPLYLVTFHEAKLTTDHQDQEQLVAQEIETVIVDASGQPLETPRYQVYSFQEPLAENVPPLEMIAILGGRFEMGSPPEEPERFDNEAPQHQVSVPPFFMGKYTVTQAQWRVVASWNQVKKNLNPNPSEFDGDQRPVENILWQDATEFCERLSRHTGRDYSLPSEAEWEYACRGGTTTPFHYGEMITPELANYKGSYSYCNGPKGEYREQTTEVGHFPPNGFGLYDMHGNVWEWCLDTWHENYEDAPTDGSAWIDSDTDSHVVRGGSWFDVPWLCRCAFRRHALTLGLIQGFRVVCRVPRTL